MISAVCGRAPPCVSPPKPPLVPPPAPRISQDWLSVINTRALSCVAGGFWLSLAAAMEKKRDRGSKNKGVEMVVFFGKTPLGYLGYGNSRISLAPRSFFSTRGDRENT